MSYRTTTLLALTALASCAGPPEVEEPATVPLFDGQTIQGWHGDIPAMDEDSSVDTAFIVRDGMLVSLGKPNGHLLTDETYADYRLEVEYRFPGEPGNCGVLVHASTLRRLYSQFPQTIEVQMNSGHAGDFWCIGEDIKVPDMTERRPGDPAKWGGDEGDARRILNLTDDSENPVGDWNLMTIECRGDRIDVWVNGTKVNDGFDATASSGQIAVQAERAEVEFKRLDLTPLGDPRG